MARGFILSDNAVPQPLNCVSGINKGSGAFKMVEANLQAVTRGATQYITLVL